MNKENKKIFNEVMTNCGMSKEYDRYEKIEKFVKFLIITIETFPENTITMEDMDNNMRFDLYYSYVSSNYTLYVRSKKGDTVEHKSLLDSIIRIVESSKDLRISLRVL